MTISRDRLFTTLGLTGLLTAGLATGGCWSPGGRLASYDEFLFESTSFDPTTITIVDTRTGQAVWSYDVPVDKALAIKFVADRKEDTNEYPDVMRWGVWKRLTEGNLYTYGSLDQPEIPVPANPYRRVDKKQRPAPELPPEMTPGLPKPPPELVPKNEPAPAPPPPADTGKTSEPVQPLQPIEPAKPSEPPKQETPPVDLPK